MGGLGWGGVLDSGDICDMGWGVCGMGWRVGPMDDGGVRGWGDFLSENRLVNRHRLSFACWYACRSTVAH